MFHILFYFLPSSYDFVFALQQLNLYYCLVAYLKNADSVSTDTKIYYESYGYFFEIATVNHKYLT